MDASVVVPALLSSTGAGARARERLRQDDDLHAPHLLDVEVLSALRRLVREGAVTSTRASTAVIDLARLPALRWDHEPLLPRMWELRDNVSAYGAAYVALAELLSATLVTGDGRVGRVPGLRCPVEVLVA